MQQGTKPRLIEFWKPVLLTQTKTDKNISLVNRLAQIRNYSTVCVRPFRFRFVQKFQESQENVIFQKTPFNGTPLDFSNF